MSSLPIFYRCAIIFDWTVLWVCSHDRSNHILHGDSNMPTGNYLIGRKGRVMSRNSLAEEKAHKRKRLGSRARPKPDREDPAMRALSPFNLDIQMKPLV